MPIPTLLRTNTIGAVGSIALPGGMNCSERVGVRSHQWLIKSRYNGPIKPTCHGIGHPPDAFGTKRRRSQRTTAHQQHHPSQKNILGGGEGAPGGFAEVSRL